MCYFIYVLFTCKSKCISVPRLKIRNTVDTAIIPIMCWKVFMKSRKYLNEKKRLERSPVQFFEGRTYRSPDIVLITRRNSRLYVIRRSAFDLFIGPFVTSQGPFPVTVSVLTIYDIFTILKRNQYQGLSIAVYIFNYSCMILKIRVSIVSKWIIEG